MKGFVVSAVIVAMSAHCLEAHAKPCRDARPIAADQAAPCSGLLVPMEQAAKAVECVTVDLPALEALRVAELRSCRAEYAAAVHIQNSERSRADRLALELDRLGDSIQPRPLWKHPALWGAIGVVVGTAGTVYLMTRLGDVQ